MLTETRLIRLPILDQPIRDGFLPLYCFDSADAGLEGPYLRSMAGLSRDCVVGYRYGHRADELDDPDNSIWSELVLYPAPGRQFVGEEDRILDELGRAVGIPPGIFHDLHFIENPETGGEGLIIKSYLDGLAQVRQAGLAVLSKMPSLTEPVHEAEDRLIEGLGPVSKDWWETV